MRIYEIKFLGKQAADGVPQCLVSVLRVMDCDIITINIIDPKGERECHITVNSSQDIREIAKYLQHELGDGQGTRSQIRKYRRLLEYFFEDAE